MFLCLTCRCFPRKQFPFLNHKTTQRNTPGPGTYSVSLSMVKPSSGTVGILENGGNALTKQPTGGSGLTPGLYRHSSSIQELLDKQISKKGPYELFSGERQQPSKSLVSIVELVAMQIKNTNPLVIVGDGSFGSREVSI